MNDLNGAARPPAFADDMPEQGAEHAAPNPILRIHRRLRGRYPLAIVLGVVFATVGGVIGYKAVQPKFASAGIVEVKPAVEKLLYDTEQNQMLPNFEAFVSAQAEYLGSERILRKAAQAEKLRGLGWPIGDKGIERLSNNLMVYRAPRGQTIQVTVADTNPQLAQAGVNAILEAYEAIYGDQLGMNDDLKLQQLEVRRTQLLNELKRKRDEIISKSDDYDADSLGIRYDQALTELAYYDQQLAAIDRALLLRPEAEAADEQPAEDQASEETPEDADGAATMTLAELALKDTTLAQLLDDIDHLDAEIAALSEKYGPNHRQMKELYRQRDVLDARIGIRAEHVRFQLDSEAGESEPEQTVASLTREELERRRDEITRAREYASDRVREYGRMRRELGALEAEATETEGLLTETTRRQEQLRTESKNSVNRVAITQRGDLPFMPTKDKRIQLAAAGSLAGGGLGVGLVFMLGFIRPTFRYIDEVDEAHRSAPLLGTLPDFSTGDSEDRDMAALAVHHLRNALHVDPRPGVGVVLTVTSAASGDGKTALSMALGTSFAAAGQSTIVVDADLVGRGLTREMNLDTTPGLGEAVIGGDIEDLLQDSGVDGLRVLPAGLRSALDPKQMSRANVGAVISALRGQAAVVLIDTGPILGSLEANIVAPLSDAVIIAVSRGQQARLVRASVERLTRMGAHCAGLVFNRAAAVDFRHSVSHASIMSKSRTSIIDAPTSAERERGARAALMHAVAGHFPEAEAEEQESQT